MHSLVSSSAILASTLFSAVQAYNFGKPATGQSLAVYWGQGAYQNGLASFCADSTIDIIPLAFMNVFPDQAGTYGYPGTNFGNACDGYYIDSKNETTQLLGSCTQIGQDIEYCQSQGKKVLLSLGGGASAGAYIANETSAVAFANFLHGAFGPPSSSWTGPRPFGDTCIDGFDFDIEADPSKIPVPQGAYYATMVNQLRSLGNMMITASPQCVIPDPNVSDALKNSIFDAIFVQFYNTPQCSARAFFDDTYGAYGGPATNISYDAWITWVQANSKNPNALVYLGLPAAPGATFGEMYLNTTEAQEILTYFQGKYPSQFGGAMLWEATFSQNNQVNGESYAANIKGFLTGTTTSTTTTTSPTSTFTPPTTLPTGTGSYTGGFPGPSVSTCTTTDAFGNPTTYPVTFTGSPTGTSTPYNEATPAPTNAPVTTTDRHGNTFTYTPTNIQPTGSGSPPTSTSTISPVTTTDRHGNTFTYTPTNVQPTGFPATSTSTDDSAATSSAWGEWDPSTSTSTISPVTTTDRHGHTFTYTPTNIQPTGASYTTSASDSEAWGPWDPATSTSTSTSEAWPEWDPATSAAATSTSTAWPEWDPTTTSTTTAWPEWDPSTASWEATITASDAKTVTVYPVAASPYTPTIAEWSSYWTQRGPVPSSSSSAEPWSYSPAATSTSTAAAWSFTGWASMPSYSTVSPALPAIATVTASAASGGAGTWTAAPAATTSGVGVYVQPATFTGGAASVGRSIFGGVAAAGLMAVVVSLVL